MINSGNSLKGITLLGLGPGDPGLITRNAWEVINSVSEIYLRTHYHPVVKSFPKNIDIRSFDDLYEKSESYEEIYTHIVEKILELGTRPEGVVYAVPGHPYIAETTCPQIAKKARKDGIPLRVIEGLSFIEPSFAALGVDPLPFTVIIDGLMLISSHHPPFPPDKPALIAQIHSTHVAAHVKLTLMNVYPDEHKVIYVHSAGTSQVKIEELPLFSIDKSQVGMFTSLYVPPLAQGTSFEAFQEMVAHLRAPEGCAWDREQTHSSLRPHLLEETYEVLEAIDSNDYRTLREELGDLLLQIVLHAQISSEYGEFNMSNVLHDIHTKITNRHPHVFGNLQIEAAEDIIKNWERLKAAERISKGEEGSSMLDGVAITMPALVQAQTYQKRVARVGFDWDDIIGVIVKIREELSEVQSAVKPENRVDEIGDLLFSVVNLARWYDIDAESALREANTRFGKRFSYIENEARAKGRELSDLTTKEMNGLWEAAKVRYK